MIAERKLVRIEIPKEVKEYKLFDIPDKEILAFIESKVWGNVPCCPFCNMTYAYAITGRKNNSFKCGFCLCKFHVFTNTFLSNTKVKYAVWLNCLYLLIQNYFISSPVIAEQLGLAQKTSYDIRETIKRELKNEKSFIYHFYDLIKSKLP